MGELAFVLAPGQNAFFTELAAALREEARALGAPTSLTVGWPAPEAGRAYVLIAPHEHAIIAGPDGIPTAILPRTVCICTEQPGTSWFRDAARIATRCGAVFDISPRGAELMRDQGIRAVHLPLGYSPLWDRFTGAAERPIDVAFLGGATGKRERLLGACAPELAKHRCHLVLGDNSRTNADSSNSFLAGSDKLELLARSRLLLNLHRGESPYFEFMRVLEAIHCGAAVLSEWSRDYEPLVPGEHFLSARPEAVPELVKELLSDEEQRAALALRAHAFIREQLPLRRSAERLVAAAEQLGRGRLGRRGLFIGRPPEPPLRDIFSAMRTPPLKGPNLGAALKRARLDAADLNRRLERVLEAERRGAALPSIEEVVSSPARADATPRVTVACALYNHAEHIEHALGSLLAQTFTDWELVVVDDGSTDGSGEVVQRFISEHPEAPVLLLRHPVNRGLPAARNAAVAEARGEQVLVLDSDNQLYPHCLERLAEALDADPAADFAYGILEQFDYSGPAGLSGYFGWEPERLVEDNYIDALALIRRSALEALGGYTTDRRLYGWEDYDLWCRIADRGGHAAHVPEILARYRLAPGSMISLTNLSARESREALAERCPTLFEGVDFDQLEFRRLHGKAGFGRHRSAGVL